MVMAKKKRTRLSLLPTLAVVLLSSTLLHSNNSHALPQQIDVSTSSFTSETPPTSSANVPATLDRSSEESHLRFTPELSDILTPGMGTVEIMNGDEADRQKRRRRRKKKKLLQGPGPVQSRHFAPSSMDLHSVRGFSLKRIDTPWRHLMTYTLQWETGHGFTQQFGWTPKDDSDSTLTSPALQVHKAPADSSGISGSEPQQSSNPRSKSSSLTPPSLVLRGPLTMDIHLVPMDTAKTTELVLSRVPVSVGQITLQLRTEVPTGWYRLLINFWDEGSGERPKESHRRLEAQKKQRPEPWDLSTSSLIYGPGQPKPNVADERGSFLPRQVGLWRGPDVIEVTDLDIANEEWTEFVETLSQETIQERIGSMSESWRKAELRHAMHNNQRAMQGFRPFVDPAGPQRGSWSHWASNFLRPWLPFGGQRRDNDNSNMGVDDGARAGLGALESKDMMYKRSRFNQRNFRFKEALAIMSERDLYPDYTREELEVMEDEVVERRQQLARERKNNKNDIHSSQKDKEKDAVHAQKQNAKAARLQLQKALELWNNQKSGHKEDKKQQNTSPLDLKIRIENGKVVMPVDAVVGWRSNRERVVSWEVTDELIADGVLMDIELVEVLYPLPPAQENDSQLPPQDEEEHSQPKNERAAQALVAQKQHQQQPSRAVVLTDHIPGHWGAMTVRIPAWVDSGAYQIRLSGVGRQGVRWEDVSQPFWVHSDPYLYSFAPS